MMTSKTLDVIIQERFKALDLIGVYTADCQKFESIVGKYLTYQQYYCYWSLNVLPHQQLGILVVDHLQVDESFKKYVGLFEALLGLGWEALPTSNFYDMGKDFPFTKKVSIGGKEHRLDLHLRAFIDIGSKFCKKVKVGVEDKFDIVCGEGA